MDEGHDPVITKVSHDQTSYTVLAAALFASVAAVGFTPAFAQSAPTLANSGAGQTATHHHDHATERMLPGQLADGRIAFLKAELKITPPQARSPIWSR